MEKTEYKNVLIAGVWAKGFHFSSMPLDDRSVETIKKCAEVGGKFLIRKRSNESIAKANNPEKTPQYFLEFVPASEVEAFNKRNSNSGV